MTLPHVFSRFLQALATLLAISFLVYVLIGLMPGDPVDLMAAGNPHMTPEDAARLRALYGLDQPLGMRYLHWLGSALSGDLGYSRVYNLPVLEVIWPRAKNSALLLGTELFFTILISFPLGVWIACREGRLVDRLINFFCLAGISLPHFWLSLLLICLFAVKLGWLPAAAALSGGGTLYEAKSMVLPVLTLTIAGLAGYVRYLRSAMTEALKADHIRTARSKGASGRRIVWAHAFRNALAPVITLLMLDLGTLFGGALTVEQIFAFPGMGKLMLDATMGSDFNLALAGFLLMSFFVLLANFLADVLYAVVDPRVTFEAK